MNNLDHNMHTLYDRQVHAAVTMEPAAAPLACAKGCAHCCHSRLVAVVPVEVLAIVRHVDRHFGADRRAALAARVKEGAAALRALEEGNEWGHVPCPLLEDGLCSVYTVRPLVCRGFNSFDDRMSEALFKENAVPSVKGDRRRFDMALAILRGAALGAAESGREGDAVNLTPALEVALSTADAEDRWLAGAPVFAEATLDQARVDATFDRVNAA